MAYTHPFSQGAPFWDFVASFDPEGSAHPFANRKEGDKPECSGRRGPHGGRGGCGGGARGRGGPHGHGRGGFGGWGRRRSYNEDGSFIPAVDIFETPAKYVVHASLPGVQKSDVGLDWDPEHHVLKIAGVVHRPGDEEFLKGLTDTAERKTGVFERKVPLERVDGEGITAKLEDGVLRIEVPKEEKEFEVVKKIDVD